MFPWCLILRATALRLALEYLGYASPYHMITASTTNPPDCLLWQAALEDKISGRGRLTREHWDALLGHCGAATDWPVAFFAPELVTAYPDARVILTTRPVDAWHASVLVAGNWRATEPFLRLLARLGDWGARMYHPMLHTAWSWYFNGDFAQNGKRAYKEHYALVRGLVPPERLLEFDVRQGWGPLCAFLGKDVPDVPFPHVNDGRMFRSRCMGRNWRQLGNVAMWWAARIVGLAFLLGLLHLFGIAIPRFP